MSRSSCSEGPGGLSSGTGESVPAVAAVATGVMTGVGGIDGVAVVGATAGSVGAGLVSLTSSSPESSQNVRPPPSRTTTPTAMSTRNQVRRCSASESIIDSTRVMGRGRRASGSGRATAERPERSPPLATMSVSASEVPVRLLRGLSDSR